MKYCLVVLFSLFSQFVFSQNTTVTTIIRKDSTTLTDDEKAKKRVLENLKKDDAYWCPQKTFDMAIYIHQNKEKVVLKKLTMRLNKWDIQELRSLSVYKDAMNRTYYPRNPVIRY
ncbi:MAG: hypothetical protein WCO54_01810 [Bacteroidota bacterium]